MGKAVVLIIEDSDNHRLLYQEELEADGYTVLAARSSQEGLGMLRDHHVDVVVLDIAMPGVDGIETLGKILDVDRELPVILNTAYSGYKDDFMTWAAERYVVKSQDLSELRGAIVDALAKRNAPADDAKTEDPA